MATSHEGLISKLNKLSKSELIDLLVLPLAQQKSERMRTLKSQVDSASGADLVDKIKNQLGVDELRAKIDSLEKQVISQQETIKSLSNQPESCDQTDGLDYGVGMAYSFFYGYLKLVIPRTGNADKHLHELMQDYEDTQHVEFEFYKLFILIPKSLYCPPSLEEVSTRIRKCDSLEEKKLTVAGVQNRPYKNAVYRIVTDDETSPTYVVAEYATPVKTFRDVFTHFGEHSDVYKKNRDQVVYRFYCTLDKILKESEECKKYCELILYDDKDENGDVGDVADVLLEKMRMLRK